jgi:Na+:H+ antiporter, NhaA family
MSQSDLVFERPTFIGSDRPLAKFLARPITKFIGLEVAGGVVLLVATAVALIWVNSPFSQSYIDLWHTTINVEVGPFHFDEDLAAFVNDGLMALFFFVVGLEIKREMVTGQLASVRAAALPAIAAVGGMIVPALIYFSFNAGTDGAHGWGIPMATDIAFAVGVVVLLGRRVHPSLKLFLLALAIVDDIGAIAVIAVFYTSDLSLGWLALAVAGLLLTVGMRLARIWSPIPYVMLGVFVWYATLESGVHATIAGVLLGLLTPARALLSAEDAEEIGLDLADGATVDEVRHAAFALQESVSVAERWENLYHPWTSFVIIPMFALANAGIELSSDAISAAADSRVTIGVVLGLVFGKPIGVVLFTWLAGRLGFPLPRGLDRRQMIGLGTAAGIGFTVSIFISGLAFDDPVLIDDAKIGILVASATAAVLASIVLSTARRQAVEGEDDVERVTTGLGTGEPIGDRDRHDAPTG